MTDDLHLAPCPYDGNGLCKRPECITGCVKQANASAPRVCPNNAENPRFSCRFCRVPIHGHDDPCGCSQRRGITHYASICNTCVVALDQINDTTTPLGRVATALIREAGTRTADDIGV